MNDPPYHGSKDQAHKKVEETEILDKIPNRFDPGILFTEEDDDGGTLKHEDEDYEDEIPFSSSSSDSGTPQLKLNGQHENDTRFSGLEVLGTGPHNVRQAIYIKPTEWLSHLKKGAHEAAESQISIKEKVDELFGSSDIIPSDSNLEDKSVAHLFGAVSSEKPHALKNEQNLYCRQHDIVNILKMRRAELDAENEEGENDIIKLACSATTRSISRKKLCSNCPLKFSTGNLCISILNESGTFRDLVKDQLVVKVNNKYYYILRELGSGSSCKVFSAFDKAQKTVVAIKWVNLLFAEEPLKNGYLEEIEYLKIFENSNHVIKLLDSEIKENEILIVMEKGDIDFDSLINDAKRMEDMSPLLIKFYWFQILKIIKEIHEYGIIHYDLKPTNFLLVSGHLKLIDFGISAKIPSGMTSVIREDQMGTINYMSPESFACSDLSESNEKAICKIGVKSDIWSLGCILYNLVYGHTPFQKLNFTQKIAAIINPSYNISFPHIDDEQLLDVLKKCLDRDPEARPSVGELLKHPYLMGKTTNVMDKLDVSR